MLYLTLARKKGETGSSLGIGLLTELLRRVKGQTCKAEILSAIYVRAFQSPFCREPLTQSWVMMHFPHLEIVKMTIEPLVRLNTSECEKGEDKESCERSVKVDRFKDKFGQLYLTLIGAACKGSELS
jgi:hypothetical protein